MTHEYIEIPDGDHGSVVGQNVPKIFDFFDKHQPREEEGEVSLGERGVGPVRFFGRGDRAGRGLTYSLLTRNASCHWPSGTAISTRAGNPAMCSRLVASLLRSLCSHHLHSQRTELLSSSTPTSAPDIDDVFALALALASPEIDLVGVTSVGAKRRRIVRGSCCRFLTQVTGKKKPEELPPVAIGDACHRRRVRNRLADSVPVASGGGLQPHAQA